MFLLPRVFFFFPSVELAHRFLGGSRFHLGVLSYGLSWVSLLGFTTNTSVTGSTSELVFVMLRSVCHLACNVPELVSR